MKRTSLQPLTLPTLTACSVILGSLAHAQDSNDTLSALISPSQESVASAEAATDLSSEVYTLLYRQRNIETLWNLGEAAVPALLELTRTGPIEKLVNADYEKSAFYWLSEISPKAALRAQIELSQTHPQRFRLIHRSGLGSFGSIEQHHEKDFVERTWTEPAPELRALAQTFLAVTLGDAELPLESKLAVSCRAYELGVSSKESSELIQANLQASAPYLGSAGLRHFALRDRTEVPSDLDEALALRALEIFEASIAVPALTRSPHPLVRNEAFGGIGASTLRSRRIDLIVANKDETSPRVLRSMLNVMYNLRIPSSTEVSLEQLVPLVEFAIRNQAINGQVSERMTNVVVTAVSQASPEDAPVVRELVRAIYDGDQPPTYLRFGTSGVQDRVRSAAVAQAIVEGASGTRYQPDKLIEGVSRNWLALSAFRRSSEGATLLHKIYTSFDPSGHRATLPAGGTDLASLPAEFAAEALAWLGRTDSRYDVVAAISPAFWDGAIEVLRASAFGDERPWRERCIGMNALLHQPSVASEDVDRIAALLAVELENADARRLFSTILGEATGDSTHPMSHDWNLVIEKLLASPDFRNEAANSLYPVGPARTADELEVISRVLKLAGGRIDGTSQAPMFRSFIETAVTSEIENWSVKGPLIPKRLLTHWIEQTLPKKAQYRSQLMNVVLLRGDSGVAFSALNSLVQQLRIVTKQQDRNSLLHAILQIPGETTEQVVVHLATQDLSYDERDTAFAKIRGRRKAQQFQAELLAETTPAPPTRESALVEVIGLLDHENESVRIEAIRGLETLNAVETLPRLIRIVGSGSEAERKAARQTLDRLRVMAELK